MVRPVAVSLPSLPFTPRSPRKAAHKPNGMQVVCEDFFVPALNIMCEKLKIPDDVAGATFMVKRLAFVGRLLCLPFTLVK